MYTLYKVRRGKMVKIAPISKVRNHLPTFVTKVKDEHNQLVITRGGRPVAVMISLEDLETLEIKADAKLIHSLIRAEEDLKASRLYSHEQVFKNV